MEKEKTGKKKIIFLDLMKFSDFLEENNLLCILKLYPNEEDLVCKRYLKYVNNRIIF